MTFNEFKELVQKELNLDVAAVDIDAESMFYKVVDAAHKVNEKLTAPPSKDEWGRTEGAEL